MRLFDRQPLTGIQSFDWHPGYAPACPGRWRPSLPAGRQWRPNQLAQRGPRTVLFAGSALLRPTG